MSDNRVPRSAHHAPKSSLEIWLVTLAALAAAIYFMQLVAMKDSVDVTRKSSERQDRAWVAVQPKGTFRIVAGEELGIPFVLVNTGRTPARHIHTEMWARFVATESLEELPETGPRLQIETGDLFPNNINEAEGYNLIRAGRQRGVGGHETASLLIEPDEVAKFDAGGIYAVAYMVVSYEDIFGVRHWT